MIVIVGAGALGSHAAIFLRNAGSLIVIDFDRVTGVNVQAQMHVKQHLGRNKAQAVQQVLQSMFGVKAEAVPHRLTPDNADVLLRSATLVLDCTDNKAARDVIQMVVRVRGIPCLHGALAEDGVLFGRAVWDELFNADAETPGAATCENGEHLPFVALAASFVACVAQEYLTTKVKRSIQFTPSGVAQIG